MWKPNEKITAYNTKSQNHNYQEIWRLNKEKMPLL